MSPDNAQGVKEFKTIKKYFECAGRIEEVLLFAI